MEETNQRLGYIITHVAGQWHFIAGGRREASPFIVDPKLEFFFNRLWANPDIVPFETRERFSTLRASDITFGAAQRMIFVAGTVREAKQAQLDSYPDDVLELYVADFVIRAYTKALESQGKFLERYQEVVITEKIVDKTVETLPEDWPTDWWLKRGNQP